MSNKKHIDIEALIREATPVTEAIRRGWMDAMKRHIQAGESMVSHRDGRVVHIPPEELAEMLAAAEAETAPEQPKQGRAPRGQVMKALDESLLQYDELYRELAK